MRWFLQNSKFSFDPSRQYPLHMALDIYKRPKSKGGFGLVCIKSKALAFKWKLFNRYRTVNCPFSKLLYSQLKVSRKNLVWCYVMQRKFLHWPKILPEISYRYRCLLNRLFKQQILKNFSLAPK